MLALLAPHSLPYSLPHSLAARTQSTDANWRPVFESDPSVLHKRLDVSDLQVYITTSSDVAMEENDAVTPVAAVLEPWSLVAKGVYIPEMARAIELNASEFDLQLSANPLRLNMRPAQLRAIDSALSHLARRGAQDASKDRALTARPRPFSPVALDRRSKLGPYFLVRSDVLESFTGEMPQLFDAYTSGTLPTPPTLRWKYAISAVLAAIRERKGSDFASDWAALIEVRDRREEYVVPRLARPPGASHRPRRTAGTSRCSPPVICVPRARRRPPRPAVCWSLRMV